MAGFEKQSASWRLEKVRSIVTHLFFHQLLTQQVPLLLLLGTELLLLLILLSGSCHVVLSLTQQVGALPAGGWGHRSHHSTLSQLIHDRRRSRLPETTRCPRSAGGPLTLTSFDQSRDFGSFPGCVTALQLDNRVHLVFIVEYLK